MTLHLLALETSSSICDVALLSCRDGDVRIHTDSNDETGRHAECLLPMIDGLLARAGIARADLDAIAFGQGPGGFTGLRVACGVTQGMAFGLDIPVIPVPSLLAVAQRAAREQGGAAQDPGAWFLVVQDARMGELYLAVYRSPLQDGETVWSTIQEPMLIDSEHVSSWLQSRVQDWGLAGNATLWVAGDALDSYPFLADMQAGAAAVQSAGALRADAVTIARIGLDAWRRGDTHGPEHAVPLYVRDKVAYTLAEQQRGAGGNPRAPAHGVSIAAMTSDHLDAVAAIEARVQQFPWTRRNFADGLAAGYPAWVASENGRVIGFYMAMVAPDVAHLLVIAVDPDHQGRGVGKRLLDHCQELASRQGVDTIVLEVRQSNHAAIGFYEHNGFHAFSERKDYYPAPHGTREHASVMKKTWQLPGNAS